MILAQLYVFELTMYYKSMTYGVTCDADGAAIRRKDACYIAE
jgi:hypothetical protein